MSSVVAQDRLAMGASAVLTVAEAARRLPIHRSRALEWLEDHGLIKTLAGSRVVIWGDILDCLAEAEAVVEHRRLRSPAPGRIKLTG